MKKYKIEIISALIGILVVFGFYSILKNVYSNKAETKIYAMNGISGQSGSELEGLSLSFEREKINCSGFFVFECSIDDVNIRMEAMNQNIFKIKNVNISGLTKDGFNNGRNYNPKVRITGIELADKSSLTTDASNEAIKIKSLLTPFNLLFEINRDTLSLDGVTKSFFNIEYSSNVADIKLTGNLHTEVNNNVMMVDKNLSITRDTKVAIGEKTNPLKIVTIIDDFKVSLIDKNSISDLIYSIYRYYITAYKSDKEREFFNIYTIGLSSPDVATEAEFKDEINQRFQSLIPHYDDEYITTYLNVINDLIENKLSKVTLSGKNKDNYTLFELNEISNLNELKGNENKFFHLSIESEGK